METNLEQGLLEGSERTPLTSFPPLAKRKTTPEMLPKESKPLSNKFYSKLSLAWSIAFWVSVFFIPVISQTAHDWFFIGLDLKKVLHSPDFEDYWPNTVQLIVFTVYMSTGNTCQLAWQGVAGTLAAGINQWCMGHLFPYGGKCEKLGIATGNGMRAACLQHTDPNYGKYEWFVWLDAIGFIFLCLASNSNENTMKFGMSWHIFYMMAFMSPTGYIPSHAVTVTTFFGAFLAILVTLVPKYTGNDFSWGLLTAYKIGDHPKLIANAMKQISSDAVKFMLADKPTDVEERYRFKVDRVAIENKVNELPGIAAAMLNDHEVSWWEGWLFGLRGASSLERFRQKRSHCGIFAHSFQDDIGGFDDVACIIKRVTMDADSSTFRAMEKAGIDEMSKERKELRVPLEALNNASMDLLMKISDWQWAQRHPTSEDDASPDVQEEMAMVTKRWRDLYDQYHNWTQTHSVQAKSPARQELRRNMSVFVFAILQLAKEVIDLTKKVKAKYKGGEKTEQGLANLMMEAFKSTWFSNGTPFVLSAFKDPEKRSFVLRNTLSIGICFLMGNILQGNVFHAYDASLASTLAVLVSHFPGSAFYKNLMRLLGLAIGNALPIIMLAVVSLFGDYASFVHFLAFFLFELYFTLMYYTSPEWKYVGCIVAGFGCYSFVGTAVTWNKDSFAAGYCKLGGATAAITVQIVVDQVGQRGKFPRDIVVENMRKFLYGESDALGLLGVFEKFQKYLSSESSKEVIEDIKNATKKLKELMIAQQQMVSECEAKTTMIAGPKPPFKLDLYKGALTAVKELLDEVDALCLVDEFGEFEGMMFPAKWYDTTFDPFYTDVLVSMNRAFKLLMRILEQNKEDLISKMEVKEMICNPRDDCSVETNHLRMAVVRRILTDSLRQTLEIERLCCQSGSLELEE